MPTGPGIPVTMEGYNRVKHLLDSLCSEMNLKSWTTHENFRGVTVTLRFVDLSDSNRASGDVTPESETWIKKKQSAIKRDKMRMEKYNKSFQSGTRHSERLEKKSIDNMRCEEKSFSESRPMMSPVAVLSEYSPGCFSDQISMDASSPECCAGEAEPSLAAPEPHVDMPASPLMDECIHSKTSPDSNVNVTDSGNDGTHLGPRETFENVCSGADLVPEINRNSLFSHLSDCKPELLDGSAFLTEIKCLVCGITLPSLRTRKKSLRLMRYCHCYMEETWYGCQRYICGYNSCKIKHDRSGDCCISGAFYQVT